MSTLAGLDSEYPLETATLDEFRERGHALLRGLASAQELAPYRVAINSTVQGLSADRAPLAERDTYGKAFLQVMNLWRINPTVEAFVRSPRFASVAAQLLGVDRVRVYHDQALFKEPRGGYTPWHQDAMYWPLDGTRCVTMWMPLIDITPDMGALTFASGSHRAGALSDISISDASEEYFDRLLADGGFPLVHPVPMAAGDATFHAGWTVHKASDNVSDRMRGVMTVIWYEDGLRVQPPANPAMARDLAQWLPGLRPGDVAATSINPVTGNAPISGQPQREPRDCTSPGAGYNGTKEPP